METETMLRKYNGHAPLRSSMLKVRKNRRVQLHYRVTLSTGEEFDASDPDQPLEIICGRGDTIQGLEKRMLGMEPGDQKDFVIPPEEAFGPYDYTLLKRMSRDELPETIDPTVGQVIPFRSKGTEVVGRVIDVNDQAVTADFNHPLAGKDLHYHVEIIRVEEPVADISTN